MNLMFFIIAIGTTILDQSYNLIMMVLTLLLPFFIFSLNEYKNSNQIIQQKLSQIFNIKTMSCLFLTCCIILLVSSFPDNLPLNHVLLKIKKIKPIIFAINTTFIYMLLLDLNHFLKETLKIITNPEEITQENLEQLADDQLSHIINHALGIKNTNLVDNIANFILNNNKYEILDLFSRHQNIENSKILIKIYASKEELDNAANTKLEQLILSQYFKITKEEKKELFIFFAQILWNKNVYIFSIKKTTFIFNEINNSKYLKNNFLYKELLNFYIRPNLKHIIKDEDEMLLLYNFAYSCLNNKEYTQQLYVTKFIEFFKGILKAINNNNNEKESLSYFIKLYCLFLYDIVYKNVQDESCITFLGQIKNHIEDSPEQRKIIKNSMRNPKTGRIIYLKLRELADEYENKFKTNFNQRQFRPIYEFKDEINENFISVQNRKTEKLLEYIYYFTYLSIFKLDNSNETKFDFLGSINIEDKDTFERLKKFFNN